MYGSGKDCISVLITDIAFEDVCDIPNGGQIICWITK